MCWEDVARWHLVALALRLGMPIPTMRSSRACDIDGLAHRAMQGRTVMRPEVMLNDIMGRIPSDAKGRLEALAVSEELESEELVKSHMAMLQEMLSDSAAFFPIDARDVDLHTGQVDYVYSANQREQESLDHGALTETSSRSSSQNATRILTAAGTPCLPFSRRNTNGKHRGLAHPSIQPTFAWIAERKARASSEDLGFHECTVSFPEQEMLHKPLRQSHVLKTIRSSPTDWSAPRRRQNSVIYSPNKYVWMGSSDHQAEFATLFPACTKHDASIFMIDKQSSVQVVG